MDELREKLISRRMRFGKPARSRRLSIFALGIAVTVLGCSPADNEALARPDSSSTAHGGTAVSMDEALRRFNEALPSVTRLEGGASSRDGLVSAFITALEANDTAAVGRMHVSRAEYAHLYFPTSIYMNKPYQQDPALAWFLSAQNSETGITRALRRLGGHGLAFESYECATQGREGENTFWRSCTISYVDPQEKARVTRRLFGAIIERGGQHKFLSYANDF